MELVANFSEVFQVGQSSEGGTAVPALALLVEQLVQWKYGLAGAVGLLLISVGIETKSHKALSAGAVLLAVLLAGPAL
ncbi:hypothetical protein SRB17_62150 [Streptomyces sp. RB17]|nr:hypothetical protein [Streptomyces sp. RB17]